MKIGKTIALLLVLGVLGIATIWYIASLLFAFLMAFDNFDTFSMAGSVLSLILALFFWLCYGAILSYALERSDGLKNFFGTARNWLLRNVVSRKGLIITVLIILFGFTCWLLGKSWDLLFGF